MADDDARARRTTGGRGAEPVKKAATKAPAKKAPAPAERAAVTKAGVKKAGVKKVPAKKAPAAAAAKKAPGREPSALLSPRKKAPPRLRLAAEDTFDDQWEPPAPEPVREDPHARIRGILAAAARSIESNEPPAAGRRAAAPAAQTPQAPAPPPPPPDPDEPVTRVLVAPTPPAPGPEEDDDDFDAVLDEAFEDEEDEEPEPEGLQPANAAAEHDSAEEEADWSPPEVLDDGVPPARSWTTPTGVAAERPTQVFTAPPATERSTQVFTAPTPPTTPPPTPPSSTPPPPARPEPTRPAADGGQAGTGAGMSIVAILVAIAVPVLGAIAGFFLSVRGRRRGAALAGVARVVSVLALVAWVAGTGLIGYRVLHDDGVEYSKLKVGDCFDSSASNQVRTVKVKPCAKPHDSEIYALVTHPAAKNDPYPGKDPLVQFAADACLGQPFTEYVGVPLEQSKLKDFEIVPQTSTWKAGARVLVCGVDTGGQKITGSVKGTRR